MKRLGISLWIALACVSILPAGCKSYWVEARIENQTGQSVRELEVDYPSASFGANALAPGAVMPYRFQVSGSGAIQVAYRAADGKAAHASGPSLIEHQQGVLTIRLLPEGKVEFLPNLKPAS